MLTMDMKVKTIRRLSTAAHPTSERVSACPGRVGESLVLGPRQLLKHVCILGAAGAPAPLESSPGWGPAFLMFLLSSQGYRACLE